MRVIVIGGGVIGVSAAYRLAQRGAEVTLLEAGALGSGTSGTSFAWLNSNSKAPLPYHRLNVAGMDEHLRLRDELGDAPWLHLHGNAIWEHPVVSGDVDEPAVPVRGETLSDRIARLRAWNYPVGMVSPADLAGIHPEIRPHDGVEEIAYFPREGWADVPLLVAHLARAARRHGATIRTGTRVAEITRTGDRVTGVLTDVGERLEADVVLSCAGRWTEEVATLAGATVAMAPTPGLLVLSTPVATTLRSLAHSSSVNLRPAGGSRVLMASFGHDARLGPDDTPATIAAYAEGILEQAQVVLPDLAGASVSAKIRGVRSIPADAFPVVGRMPGVDGFAVVATHSGVTMGPLLGRLIATELLDGVEDELVETFRPDRLMAGTSAG